MRGLILVELVAHVMEWLRRGLQILISQFNSGRASKRIMNIKYRPEIDGLRAISIIAVIIYHSQLTLFGNKLLTGGFIGVDIFFVISGCLIT